MELRHRALEVLCLTDPEEKAAAALDMYARQALYSIAPQAPALSDPAPDLPGRPLRPELRHHTAVARRSPATPEGRAILLETLCELDAMLAGLGARVRKAFLLSQLDGLTYPQIAARMDLSVNVVQKAMLKAYRHCYLAVYAP